jgi:DNA mismatch repair protein MutS
MAATPMMQQYHDAKAACGDALLLFRMGDFYELFFDDARAASRVLGLTLTSRDKGENPVPMAGFPYHQLESYLAKLIAAGFRAAVCEQVEDPKLAKGLVKREVTRVVSPGTLTDDALLDPRECNFLAAVALPGHKGNGDDRAGLAWAELSTGRFYAATVPLARLGDELARIGPAECLVSEDSDFAATEKESPAASPRPLVGALQAGTMLTRRPAWAFGLDTAIATLQKHFQTATLEGFGFGDDDTAALRAAGAVLDYLCETQRTSLGHIDRLTPYRAGEQLEIDEATRRSLEITRTLRSGERQGSLLWVIDKTVTPMGSRLLAEWIASPLTNLEAIDARLDAVGELYDLERLLARVATGRASPRDLSFVSRTLAALPKLKARLTARKSPLLVRLESELDLCPEIRAQLESALVDDCPLATRDGGILRGGYSGDLDRLRDLAAGGKQWIAKYQAEEVQRTGIPNLKVGYNKVFGYYLEITNAHKDKTPPTTSASRRRQKRRTVHHAGAEGVRREGPDRRRAGQRAGVRAVCRAAGCRAAGSPPPAGDGRGPGSSSTCSFRRLAELARVRGYCRPIVAESRC